MDTLAKTTAAYWEAKYGYEKYRRQLQLEREMSGEGERKAALAIAEAKVGKHESTTLYGSALLKRGIESLTTSIEDFIDTARGGQPGRRHIAAKLLGHFPDMRVVAFLSLREVLQCISRRATVTGVAQSIATILMKEAKLIKLKEDNPELYKFMTGIIDSGNEAHRYRAMSAAMKRNDIEFELWSGTEREQLGIKLIDLIINSTGYIEIMPEQRGRSKTVNFIAATPKCREWIEKCEKNALLMPEYWPTIIPPRPWTGAFDGAYYTDIKPVWLVKARFNPRNYLEELDNRKSDMPTVYKAVNAIQETGYRIQKKVYEVMRALWEAGNGEAGLPIRGVNSLPVCPLCGHIFPVPEQGRRIKIRHECFEKPENAEVFKSWKRSAENVYKSNATLFGRQIGLAKILSIAAKFLNEETIYFPMQLDFRGRVYPVPAGLTPQGSDWAKGLLEFAEGKPLQDMEAVKWLAIHGANVFGEDKISLDDRFFWVLEHEKEIIESARNPHNFKWWQTADKPFQFLSFCYEWAGYVEACENGEIFVSHTPVAMDGTCNGLQIFSMLLRDEVGGRATNLISGDKPADIYATVAAKVIEKLKTKSKNGKKRIKKGDCEELYNEKILAPLLLELDINRKTTKRQVMTLPYGATFSSCKEYTLAWLEDKRAAEPHHEVFRLYPGTKLFRAAIFLAEMIWEAIHETVIAARGAMEYLQTLAAAVTREGLPVTWTTPVGLKILQAYKEIRSKRIQSLLGGTVIASYIKEETPKLDLSEQKNGISPNFIHSLDAAAMMKTVEIASSKGVTSYAMVHDSYATHAADAPVLADSLRHAFVELFEADILAMFRNEVIKVLPESVKEDLPPLPDKGKLDINEVLKSQYFFA